MNVYDIILLASAAPPLAALIFRKLLKPWIYVYSAAWAIYGLFHIFFQNARAAAIPAYAFMVLTILVLAFNLNKKKLCRFLSVFISIPAVIVMLLGIGVMLIFPIAKIPALSGPYSVGKAAYLYTDRSRSELMTARENDLREIPITIYYPAENVPGGGETLTSVPYRYYLYSKSFPYFMADYLDELEGKALEVAPVLAGKYPLLVYTHDAPGFSLENSLLLEELASRGMIVLSVGHPNDSAAEIAPDGRVIPYNKKRYSALNGEDQKKLDFAVRLVFGGRFASQNKPPYSKEIYEKSLEAIRGSELLLDKYLASSYISPQGREITWEADYSASEHVRDIIYVLENIEELEGKTPGILEAMDADNRFILGKGIGAVTASDEKFKNVFKRTAAIRGSFSQAALSSPAKVPLLYICDQNDTGQNDMILDKNPAPAYKAVFPSMPFLEFNDFDIFLPTYRALGKSMKDYLKLHEELADLLANFFLGGNGGEILSPSTAATIYQIEAY